MFEDNLLKTLSDGRGILRRAGKDWRRIAARWPQSLDEDADTLVQYAACLMLLLALVTFVACMLITAPYGRHNNTKAVQAGSFGPLIPARLAWLVMEAPNLLWVAASLCLSFPPSGPALALPHLPAVPAPNAALLGFFALHYTHRALVFPLLRMKRTSNPMPLLVAACAGLYCTLNGFLQAWALTRAVRYPEGWVRDPRFVAGMALAALGAALNVHADSVLINLSKGSPSGRKEYKVPRGGLFEYVSAANYSAEMLEWAGWAVACWSLPALAFAVYTFSNLAPRGAAHHRWYLAKFREEYPQHRRAVLPFLW